ncbi:MAG: hypothetical protein GXY68_00605 [Chloroflexi bacterium]|nr:hypothetical protein [Chloroflexota bacterium]
MAQIPAELLSSWRDHPNRATRIIVKVQGDLLERQQELLSLGAVVVHAIRLTNSLTLVCDGETALMIVQLPWIVRLSLDTSVSALERQAHE